MTTKSPAISAPRWLECADGWAPLVLVVICTLWAGVQLYAVATTSTPPQGYETERVAKAIAQGHDFSMPNDHRWLFDAEPGFDATAWVDPVYAYALAGMYSTFGERAPAIALCLNVAAAVACFMVLFQLVQRFTGAFVAVLAVALLALQPWFRVVTLGMGNATWGALLIVITALLLIRTLEKPSRVRAALLGLSSGVSALTLANTLLFIPVVAILVATVSPGTRARRAVASLIAFVLSCLTVAPWTIRNALEFGEFVPVRTGAGQLAHAGVVMLGSAIDPESVKLPAQPLWRAETPRLAVKFAATTDGRNALERAQREVFRLAPPPGYDDMNEAQRDKVHLLAARDYILHNPLLSAVMGVFKLELFARRMGSLGTWTLFAAYLTIMFLYRDRRVMALGTLVLVYALPFAIFIAYFHRYRSPIEPLVAAIACIGAARFLVWLATQQRVTSLVQPLARLAAVRRAT